MSEGGGVAAVGPKCESGCGISKVGGKRVEGCENVVRRCGRQKRTRNKGSLTCDLHVPIESSASDVPNNRNHNRSHKVFHV